MKQEKIEVKSKGKVIGEVVVPEFENVAEAIKTLTEAKVLALVNRQHKADLTNEFRASKTRTKSPQAQLAALAKTNPAIQEEIAKLLAKHAAAAGK